MILPFMIRERHGITWEHVAISANCRLLIPPILVSNKCPMIYLLRLYTSYHSLGKFFTFYSSTTAHYTPIRSDSNKGTNDINVRFSAA